MVRLARRLFKAEICFMSLHSNFKRWRLRLVLSDLVEVGSEPRPFDTRDGRMGISALLTTVTCLCLFFPGIEDVGGGGGGIKIPFLGGAANGPWGPMTTPVESK